MAAFQKPVGVDRASLAGRLWDSMNAEPYLIAASEAEAAARWSDRVASELRANGRDVDACYEMRKGQDDRRRARVLRETAKRLGAVL